MNQRNTAVKRIHADVKELNTHPSSRYSAVPLEDNIFEWHFTIRGPKGSDFEGGIYHGRILLSPEYPFKPPHIIFLTKNGRFEVGTRICLSISAYHPEHWQPAWGVRTMLEAIISFLPTPGNGAIGALDWTPKERKKLAVESHNYVCPICGAIDNLIELPEDSEEVREQEMQDQVAQLHIHGIGNNPTNPLEQQVLGKEQNEDSLKPSSSSENTSVIEQPNKTSNSNSTTIEDHKKAIQQETKESTTTITTDSNSSSSSTTTTTTTTTATTTTPQPRPQSQTHQVRNQTSQQQQQHNRNNNQNRDTFDDILFYSMVVIGLAIVYLLVKKYNRSHESNQEL